ncbi:MAG: ATP-binding cassette domain-containing protein [Tissierellia bacterium]|nr:ATP-binding cassette domain-containing protein [Tissierellia bacterium]
MATKALTDEIYIKKEKLEIDKEDKKIKLDDVFKISFKDLSFKYDENYIFENLNFNFTKGKKYLIQGESGSGKSTLGKIMIKLLKSFHGEILFDQIPIDELSTKNVNSLINYISQDPYVFNTSLKENIDIKGKLDDGEIIDIIKKVRLDKLLHEIGSIDALIDKVNRNISGGEIARIAIARALADDKPVIIADEVLANLDKINSLNIEELLLSIDDKIIINICHHHNIELNDRYDGILEL